MLVLRTVDYRGFIPQYPVTSACMVYQTLKQRLYQHQHARAGATGTAGTDLAVPVFEEKKRGEKEEEKKKETLRSRT